MSKSSKKRKKEKALRSLNKELIAKKEYMTLPPHRKLLRCLKESGEFKRFISLVMKKHHTGIQGAINIIKSNTDIFYLIGHFENSGWNMWGGQSGHYINFDKTTSFYYDLFYKFKPTI
jgi:hypothetical protein